MPARLRVVPDGDQTTAPLRALIYGRVSVDRGGRGKSTESQVAELARAAESQGWTIVDQIVDDGVSASTYARRDREGWRDAVAMIEAGAVDVLMAWEFSRATRDLEVFVELRRTLQDHGVLLYYQHELYDLRKASHRRRVGHDAVDAEADSGQTSERVLRQKGRDAEKGWPAGDVPYGYRRVYSERSGHLEGQVPDAKGTALIVRELVDGFLAGTSLSRLARDMQSRGIPTPKPPRKPELARGWTASTVGQVLRSPSIAGLRQHTRAGERVFYEADWEPIITRDERAQILAILNDPKRVVHRGIEPTHLLSHLAVCAACGVPMRHRYKVQGGRRYAAYTCDRSGCRAVYIQAAPADDVVARAVIAVLSDRESLQALRGMTAADAAERRRAEAQVADLEAELADLEAAWKARDIKATVYARTVSGVEEQLAEARGALAPRVTAPILSRLATARDVAAAWAALPVADQRAAVRALFEVRLHRAAARGTRTWDPRRVEVLPLARG